MNTLRIAWRSIWRNSRRTAITIAAIALNTTVLIVTFALMDGMLADTVHNITHLLVGDAQVHASEYRLDRSFYRQISNHQLIMAKAKQADIFAAARSYGYGLVSVGNKSAGALFLGVDPHAERQAFDLANQLLDGEFLPDQRKSGDPENYIGEIVLGRKLAKSLNAGTGCEIVAVVQAADGSMGNELFKVRGILKTVGDEVDRAAAIIHREDFNRLFASDGIVHEIAFNAKGRMKPEEVTRLLESVTDGLELVTWKQLMPAMANMVGMWDAFMWIFSLIFFLAAGMGVMNTMLMATFERIREFGMIKAMGATPWRIVLDVAAEAFILALVSTAIGALLGLSANIYFHAKGLDLSWVGGDVVVSGVAFNSIWKATLTIPAVINPVITMWVVCVLAALYPAIKAARLNTVKAINHV